MAMPEAKEKEKIAESIRSLAVPLEKLKPDPENPRLHGEYSIKALKESLKRYGQVKPIVATEDGTIIAGNGLYFAAKELGWEHIAVVYVDYDPVTARAFAIMDNRSAELSMWDTDRLGQLIQDLLAEDVKLAGLGFREKELEELGIELDAITPKKRTPKKEEGSEETSSGAFTPLPDEEYELPLPEWIEKHKKVFIMMSGGKDSTAVAAWCKENLKEMPEFVYIRLPLDFPGTEEHVKKLAKKLGAPLLILGPSYEEGMRIWLKGLLRWGFPNYASHLWCHTLLKQRLIEAHAEWLKKRYAPDEVCVLIGIRAEESLRRSKRAERVRTTEGFHAAHPILNFTVDDVWAIIKKHKLPIHPAYKYMARFGCYACPNHEQAAWDALREHAPELFIKSVQYLAVAAMGPGPYAQRYLVRDLVKVTGAKHLLEEYGIDPHEVATEEVERKIRVEDLPRYMERFEVDEL